MTPHNARQLPPRVAFEPPVTDWPHAGVYQLWLRVSVSLRVMVGRLGCVRFPAGRYVYTGRAARRLRARVRRHLVGNRCCHWHIDYLLRRREVHIECVRLASADPEAECAVNQTAIRCGILFAPGFGASDCRQRCRSHLRFLGPAADT